VEAPSPFSSGSADAFADGKQPTVDDTRKSATASEKLKDHKPGYLSGSPNAPVKIGK
jgi:hypothetical protein